MHNKKLTALLGSLLLLAAAMPLAMAHQTSSSQISDNLTPLSADDDWRREKDSLGNVLAVDGTNGVSGNYYRGIGALLISDILFPEQDRNAVSFAFALCDFEVLGNGDAHDPLDEDTVDEDDGSDSIPQGLVPDGTWDDGGVGAACHTRDHYAHSGYNTPGCSGRAYAEDAVLGPYVWILAACDWATHGSGPGLSTCVVNELISSPSQAGLTECVATFLAGGATGGFVACGDDASADGSDFGFGGGNTAWGGVNFPLPQDSCTQGQAVAAVFVVDYGGHPPENPAGITVGPAVGGWIDTIDWVDAA